MRVLTLDAQQRVQAVEAVAAGRSVADAWVFNHMLDTDSMSLWGFAINGGSRTTPNLTPPDPARHPGVARLRSSTTANSGFRVNSLVGFTSLSKHACVQAVLAAAGLATGLVRVGYLDTTSHADADNGMYFEVNHLTVRGKTAAGGVRSETAGSYALTADAFYRFEVRANADYSAVTFTVYDMDGAALWTESLAANLPPAATACAVGLMATSSGATAANICHVDYLGGGTWDGWLHHLGLGLRGEKGEKGDTGEPGAPGESGVTAHGALTGLGNNDHPQYVLLSDMLGWAANVVTVIPVNTVIHVRTTGNDTTGDGSEAAPFATLIRAMDWLSMRRIASTAFVTVQLGAGVFTLSSGISLDHVDGARITIRGRGMGDGTGDTTRLHLTSGRITVTSRLAICNLEISHASNVSGTWVVLVDGNAAFLTLGVTNQNEPVRIRSGNYGVFVTNQAMFRMYGGEVLDFTGRGISADRNTFVSLYGNTYPITIDPNSAGSGTVAGTIGISAATAAMVQRVGTVNILDCTTPTSADAYSNIL